MLLGQYGKGRAWKKRGVYILSLQGSESEMARQHGALLKHVIPSGAVPFLGSKNANVIRNSYIVQRYPFMGPILLKGIETLQKPMSAAVPPEYKQEAFEMAKASGIPLRMVQQTSLQADTLLLLLRHSMGRFLVNQLKSPYLKTGFPGCTSFVALQEHTDSGKGLIHARNMDYPSVGHWDTYPTVLYCDPTEGQRTVGIMTAGLHTVGITAINESGLTLTVHFHCSKDVSVFGIPIHIIGSEVMRRAHTLGEAIDLISALERAGSWSMVISSAKENKAAVVEVVHGQMAVRDAADSNGLLVNGNKFQNELLAQNEVLLSTSAVHDFQLRPQRALDLLRETLAKGYKISEKTCGRILGDQFDKETNEMRLTGNTIAVVTTVTSIISQLQNGKLWVAARPESPVSVGPYLELDPFETFEDFDDKEPPLMDWLDDKIKPVTARGNPALEEALSEFRKAYIEYQNNFNADKALIHLTKATELNPTEGHFWIAAGHMYMKKQNPKAALHQFEKASGCKLSPHMTQTLALFTGQAHDALGNRTLAKEQYDRAELIHTASPQVEKELKRCQAKPFTLKRSEDFTFDLQYCDCFDYP